MARWLKYFSGYASSGVTTRHGKKCSFQSWCGRRGVSSAAKDICGTLYGRFWEGSGSGIAQL